ncbi:TPR repeat-containing protein [Granulicella sibirica]|uniref:TPR repeat-containing protein n=2 Tax=Granulicella sibirica TaxID=2479048 RepID=A0A4Q0T6Y5_9BACT|nr:TPR repeat-containing protein [Granulicella sibirica]
MGLLLTLFAVSIATAQSASDASSDAHETSGRLVLVLPFENRSGQPTLQWIGDSFPDTINQRLNSAGFLTITRDDRQYALDHLGFPADFRPTHATTIRIAQTLDANFVVVGSFNVQNGKILVQAQVLEVDKLKLSQALNDSSDLARLFDVENAIAWKVARQIDPKFSVAEQTFLSASGGVKLTAFEGYIRGISATNPQERIKRLQGAVTEEPKYAAALLALGKAQYTDRQYAAAAATLIKVPRTDRSALEAGFYLGLAHFNAAKYADAEAAFAFVASRLPLPEVVNNQGVAASRQGRDAGALFQRATAADPGDADYHFNLAVSLMRRGDAAGSLHELEQTLKLHASDTEAADLRSRITAARLTGPGLKGAVETGGFEPLERIRRSYSEASFRQAAFQLDQMRGLRLAALPPTEQGAAYSQQGRDYLAQGLVPEAELEFQKAIAADPKSAMAHAGLAQVREQSGSVDDARKEANASIMLKPNVVSFLVLARLDLQANQMTASAVDVGNALRIEPGNSAAMGMRTALAARGQAIP